MNAAESLAADAWCAASFAERRAALVEGLTAELNGHPGVLAVAIEPGPVGREYDLTASLDTDVGRLRTPLWSHTRATLFCDASIHPANRGHLSPKGAVAEAAERLRARLAARYRLESRGLTVEITPAPGVERTWVAEHSPFRGRTLVTREDRIQSAGGEDLRTLLARFYTGPSLRVTGPSGDAFLLPAASDVEGPLVTLCHACAGWLEGASAVCGRCGSDHVEAVVAARPARFPPSHTRG